MENNEFLERIEDLSKRCANRNIVTCTAFLTPTERAILDMKKYENAYIFGGNDEAERCRAFFLPDYLEKDQLKVFDYIVAFHIKFKFEKLSHRDFLGAILGLGIERDAVGDIYVLNNEGYFYTTKEISKYVLTNLDKIGRAGIELKEIGLDEVKRPTPQIQEKTFTVQSLRLDGVISGAFNISREEASRIIRLGIVLRNYLVCENVSSSIKEGDIISARGFGKFKITKSSGTSRSGRTFITIEKYI